MAKKQIDYQQILNDFVADIDTNPKLTDDKLFQAYPELNNDKKMLDAAWSYYNTLKANKYDEATLQSKFPEFFGDENTAEVTESSSAEKENNSYWKSIGANNPYPLTQEDKQEMEREKAVKREDAAELPLSQRDRERETEIRRLRTEGTWGKPNGYSFGYDKEAKSPVLTYTKGDGIHLSVSATPSNKDEIDKLESERPSYVTREIKTPEDIYTSVSEAWSSNTAEGRKAKKEMDESSLRIKMLIEDDIDKQVARLQQQVANGSLSEDEAKEKVKALTDNANTIYQHEMAEIQGNYFTQMCDANADYINKQYRLLGQKATNQTISDINSRIAPQIQLLEKRQRDDVAKYNQGNLGGTYGAIGANMNAAMAMNPKDAQELSEYRQAQEFLVDAAKISEAAQRGKGFWKGLGESLGDKDTWDFGMSQLFRSVALKNIVEKYEQGTPLTDSERALMDSAVAYMSACAYNSDKLSRLYKAGQTTGESIPFMLQFMVMPVDALKNKVAKGLLGYGIEQFGGKALQTAGEATAKYGLKTALKEAGTALVGNMAAAGVQTAAFGIPKIIEGTVSRRTGDIQPEFDEQGNIVYGGRQNQQGIVDAVWNSTVDMYVENLSEMILTSLDPIKAYMGASRLFSGLKNSEIAQVLGRLNDGVIGKIRNRVQFRNYIEEVSEEYVGNLMRWGLSSDVNSADEAGFSVDQQIDTWLGLAPTSIAFGIANAAEGGIASFQSSAAARKLRSIMEDGEQRKYFEQLLASNNSDEFAQNTHNVVKSILRDDTLNEETKRNALNVIYAAYQSQLAQEVEQVHNTELDKQQEQPEVATISKEQKEGEEQYTDKDGEVVVFYRNSDGSVTLRDEDGNTIVDEQGSAVVMSENEFDKFVVDNNLTRLDDEQSALKRREDELRQHWEQIWQPRTHSDGNVYRVRLASDEMREGYIVGDGKVEIDRTDSENPHISNSDIVTVRYDDGTMEQLPAKDLDLLQAASAYDMVENTMQPFYEYAQAMQVFHIGQEVSMESEDGNTYTSRVVNISEEGVEVEIENPQGEADTTIIPNTVALSVLRPIEQQTEQSVGDITNPQPIGTNRFGNVYQWVVGKAKEAAQFLRKHKNSYLKGVFHRDEIGDIDLVWGNDKAGLQHIIRRHIEEQDDFDGINEAIEAIEQTIKNGSIVSANGSQCTIDDGIYRVAIAKDETGNWVITAYDNSRKKEEKQRSSDNSPLVVPSTERNTPSDVAFSHQENNTTSNGKGTTNNLVAQTPDINTMDADMLGATTVEYLGGDKATAKAYLEAERDKAKAEVKRLSSQKVKKYADIADFKRQNDELNAQKKASIDRLNKLEQAIITANHYKTDAEQQAEAERKAREAAIRAERRQTATTKTSNSTPAERWNSAPKVIGNTITRTLPDGTIIRGHYVLAEANTATPSHDPLNGWNTSIGFPVTEDGKNINDRDYKHDKDAQQITQQIAQTYDGQAVAQVPVVSSEGIVYDGNGRTIAGNIAAANNTDGAYIQALVGNASNFGFTAEQVAQMQHPRVYMQLDEDLPYNTTTFAKFNVQEKKTQGSTSRAVSNSKKMTEAVRDSILEIMNDYSTLESFFASETGAKNIIKVLLDNGIMTQQEVAGLTEVTDRGYLFSPTGKDYITDLLIGSLFDEDSIRMLGNDKGLKQSILRALPSIVENRRLGDYALTDSINSAIQLLYEARQAGTAYALYIRQGNAFEGYVSDRFSPFDMLLAEEMSAGVEKFRDVLELYNKTAQDESHGQTGLFGVRTIEDIKNEILQHYGKSRGQTATTEQGTERPANTQTQPPVSSTQTGDGRTKVAADIPTSKILEQIEAEAEPLEEVELTPDNWYALFGADGIVSTPIGYVKMGEHQYLKLAQKGRNSKLGMIKPTLERPSVVVMDRSQAKDGQITERDYSYVFVKAFVGKDGERVYYFTSITVSKDGKEVVVSNQEKERSRIQRLLKKGKLAYINKATLPPVSDTTIQGNQLTNPIGDGNSYSSIGKGAKKNVNDQTKLQKSAENQQNVSTTEQSEAQQSPNKIFTDDLYAAARRRIQARLNRLNAGLDPEMLSDGLIVAGYYVEKGARKFAEYTKEMVRDFGDKIRPYLKAFYNGLRDLPEATELSKEMDDYATVSAFDVNSVLLDEQEENVDKVWKKEEENIPLRPSKVDVDGVFGALNAKGEARLSDHIEQESLSSANAEDTQPIGNVTQSKHTKTGEDIWIVKPSERVGDAEFKQLKERAKAYSGYYSSFAKNRGFIFKSQDDANNFNRIGTDEGVSTQLEESQPKLATRGATKQEIAQHIKEQNDHKKKEIARKPDEQPMLDLFGDVADTMNEGVQQEHDEPERKFVNAVSRHLLGALVSEDMQTPFRSILDLRKLAKESGIEVDDNGKTDILLQELVEDGLVRAARQLVASGKYGDAKSKATYDAIVHLYEIQPTIAQRSSNRIAMQQYSTPLPMAFVADMFAYEPNMRSILEPTAGNGMLVFAVPAEKVHANELDETRLANLHLQEFQEVTSQDATEPFGGGKRYDAIIANPPFGSREEREYDGKMIAGLDPQITLNALASMKDSGKAAIIIGGNMEYADNGSVKDKKAFWSYLYDHYNVKGVVDMDGQLYRKQGTTYPTRMILIDGRRSEAEREQTTVYPPIQQKAIAKVNTFDDLYNTIAEITNSNKKTNGTEILRTTGGSSSVSDSNNTSGNTGVLGHSGQHRSNDGDGRDGGQRPTDSAGSAGGNRPNAERGVSTTPRTGGEKVSGHPMGGVLRPQEPVHGLNTTSDDGSSARPERATTDGERSGEDNVGRPGRVPVDGIRELGTPRDRVGLKSQPKRNLTEEKLPYRSHNTAFSLQSVAPAAMVEAMDNTLSQIEKSVGKSIDQFVTDELGYDTIQDAHNALAAEQMDSVAMAIYQMKQGQSLIIGDQTGVGKGRQMAALIRWAVRQGKKPIFVTQKADLFSDIYRDLVDIGSGDLRPFILNSDGAMVDANGGIVHKPLPANIQVRIFENEKLLKDFDYVVLTYSQVNTGDAISQEQMMNGKKVRKSKAIKNNKPTPKATFLRNISKDNYLFLDESHTAAGDSNVGSFFQSIIGTKIDSGVRAVTFASATFAKRPDTMPMYALRTAMAEANIEREELIDIIEKGGVTLQEIMSRALTESGQMVRRERDMSDVRTDWKTIDDPTIVKQAREQYDRTIVAFNAIIDFQDKFITPLVKEQDRELAEVMSTANLKKGTKKFGVDNTPFASKTFNYTKQLMLALKVDAIVDEVEREIKAGRHPVIALESTMESTIKDYTPGETIAEPSFSASLLKGLDNCMQYTIKDDQGVETHMTYTPNELGEEGETAYYKLQDFIRESTKDIFISPLDAIIERLHEKGYRVGELTGRNTYVERTDDGEIVVRRRTDKDKKRMQREFNSGALDVLILNKSASTGISLHASEKFSDQRQRSMIIAQPLSDINDYMQMIGRIDRTGQVHRGYYINLGLPVPAESRFLMMLSTKLKSLNANTTTSQDSESNEVDAPDLLNKYGSQVVIEYLRDNPTIYEKIGEPLKKNSKKGDDKIIHANELDEYTPSEDDALKITGRVALLNTKEQEEFYNDVVRRYNDLIRYLNDTGTNDLKITTLPLRAKTISRKVSSVGREPNGNNPFAGNAYVEQVEMDVLRKPMKANEVQKLIVQLNGTSDRAAGRKRVKDIMSIVERETEDKMTLENERYENAKQKAALTLEEYARKINANEKMSSEQKATTIEQKQQETEQKLADKNRDNILSIQHKAAYLNRMLDMFTVGETYLVPDDLGSAMFSSSTHSIFCGYKVKDNKISASTSFAVFATLDGRRKVEIKLSDISILNRINDHTNQNWDAAQQTTLDNWDKQIPTQTRKEGYIMTGNILQAVADTQDEYGNYTGQLISYTDIDGNIHDGILMPDKWKTSQLRGGVPISARLEQMKQGTVVSTDGKVTIRRGWGAPDVYFLIVPKSKSEGGKYFLNPDILRLVDKNNFYTVRGQMQAEVPAQNIEAVLGILSDMGVKAQDSTIEAQYDELDYDTDNLTDAQQLATDAVLGALDDAGISVERVSEEQAEREVAAQKKSLDDTATWSELMVRANKAADITSNDNAKVQKKS